VRLIYCVHCDDVFNPVVRNVCACEKTSTIISDGVVVYKGCYAFPVQLDERSMMLALEYYRKYGVMTRFSGWFPTESKYFKKEE